MRSFTRANHSNDRRGDFLADVTMNLLPERVPGF